MKSVLVALIVTLLVCYPAVAGPKTARELEELSGPVKVMAVEKTQLSRQFGKYFGRFTAKWVEGPHLQTYNRHYDAKGNKTWETWYGPDGAVSRRVQFAYDEAGNLLESIRYKSDGNIANKVVYTYDARGNKKGEATYRADGSLEKKSTFDYEFDSHGNWTRMTEKTSFETGEDTDWGESIYRKITYY